MMFDEKAIVSIQQHFSCSYATLYDWALFGYLDKSFDEMSEVYTSLGIIHLFALSGMQVGFFVGAFRFFFSTSWVTPRLCGHTTNPIFTRLCGADWLFCFGNSEFNSICFCKSWY